MLAMIDIMLELRVISLDNLEIAKKAKVEKLKKWSSIFGEKE